MSIMQKNSAALFALIILLMFASAGNLEAGSKFGLNLLGQRLDAGDVRSLALGGDLQLVPDSLAVLQRNPALLSFCHTDYSEKDLSVKFPTFMLSVPFSKRVVFALGYRGRYDAGSVMAIKVEGEGIPTYKHFFTRSGGLYSIPLTIAVSLSKHIAVGAYYSLERGAIDDKWEIRFKESTYTPSVGLRKTEFSGSGYGGGVVFFPNGPLVIGVNYDGEIAYDTDVSEKFTQTSLDTLYRGSATLPFEIGVSIYWHMSSSWSVLGSAGWRDFKRFEGLEFSSDRLRTQERYALGFEYGKGKSFPLRFSLAWEQLPYDFPSLERIQSYTAAIGTGLILKDDKGKIDFALQFGKTGSVDKNTLEDRYFRLVIGLSGSETWKRHRIRR
jgi:hypothetical protein